MFVVTHLITHAKSCWRCTHECLLKYCCSFFLMKRESSTLRISHKLFCFKITLISTNWPVFLIMRTLKNRLNAGFTINKVFVHIQSQHKKIADFFFIFLFLRLTDPSNFEKSLCSQKSNWSGLMKNTHRNTTIQI